MSIGFVFALQYKCPIVSSATFIRQNNDKSFLLQVL